MTLTLANLTGTLSRKNAVVGLAAAAGLLACILAANFVTSRYGVVPVGFGLMATAGTYFAGVTFVLRDSLQDAAGKVSTLGLIAVGAALSFFLADPFIALASAVAFLTSEVADLVVYTPLRKRGYIRAAATSNVVGSFVDTIIFLTIAGFPISDALAGQMVGKLIVTALAVVLVVAFRTVRKARVQM
jgi:queuosine precursor transporter